MPGQVTDGTQRHSRTVAVSRPWRDLEGSAAPGLPGRNKDNRSTGRCQIRQFLTRIIYRSAMCLLTKVFCAVIDRQFCAQYNEHSLSLRMIFTVAMVQLDFITSPR